MYKLNENYLQINTWIDKNLNHGFFTKNGGISSGEYRSLNCNTKSSDSSKNLKKNLSIVAEKFGYFYQDLKLVNQIHSNRVIIISEYDVDTMSIEADALVTTIPGILLGIRTADCVPILMHDSEKRVVAAIHAGWKGAICGIIQNTISAIKTLIPNDEKIFVAVGPSIQQQSYEVDQKFHNHFIQQDVKNSIYFVKHNDKFLFDLPRYCIEILALYNTDVIHLKEDTYVNSEDFFSYRRACHNGKHKTFGTQISVIGL